MSRIDGLIPFGTTNFEYCLITELMDQVNQVRVREGRIEAGRPKILQPENMANMSSSTKWEIMPSRCWS